MVGVTGILILWLLSSVAYALLLPSRLPAGAVGESGLSGRPEGMDGLLSCQQEVEGLHAELAGAPPGLEKLSAGYDRAEGARRTAEFQGRWLPRWQAAGLRCHFREARMQEGLGAAFNQLAWSYERLGELRDGYLAQLDLFLARHTSELEAIRHALDSSRKAIEAQRCSAAPGNANTGRSARTEGQE